MGEALRDDEDLYEVLQLSPNAEPDVLEAAYKRLVAKYHPDRDRSPDAELRIKRINLAYGVLRDPEQRRLYDWRRRGSASRAEARAATEAPPPPKPAATPRPPAAEARSPNGAKSNGAKSNGAARWLGVAMTLAIYAGVRMNSRPSETRSSSGYASRASATDYAPSYQTPTYVPPQPLRTCDSARSCQLVLSSMGYPILVDGIWGPASDAVWNQCVRDGKCLMR